MHWSNPEAQDVEVCSVLDRVIKEVERAETGQFQSVAWLSQETTAYMYPLAHAYPLVPAPDAHACARAAPPSAPEPLAPPRADPPLAHAYPLEYTH